MGCSLKTPTPILIKMVSTLMFVGMDFLIEAFKFSYNQYFLRYNQFGVPDFVPHFHHEGKLICQL